MKYFNILILIAIATTVGFASSVLYLGSTFDIDKLIANYWTSFAERYFLSVAFGLVSLFLLAIINWLAARIFNSTNSYRKLLVHGFFTVMFASLLGTIFFMTNIGN